MELGNHRLVTAAAWPAWPRSQRNCARRPCLLLPKCTRGTFLVLKTCLLWSSVTTGRLRLDLGRGGHPGRHGYSQPGTTSSSQVTGGAIATIEKPQVINRR